MHIYNVSDWEFLGIYDLLLNSDIHTYILQST